MEDRIFFKDKSNTLKGPFTERQVQEWYRQKWFDSSFPFYFTQDNKSPSDVENGGITLEELRSLNGIGCPFSRVDGRGSDREKRRERLEKIEKEIADLKQKCAAVPGMERSLEQVQRKLEGLAATLNKNITKPAEKAPKVDPNQAIYEENIADCILCTIELYGKEDWSDWQSEKKEEWCESHLKQGRARKAECERILVEKMKEKEFFVCQFCVAIMFNYKQALIHFTSKEHVEKEPPMLSQLGFTSYRRLLDAFTDLPARLAAEDAKIEQERRKKFGSVTFTTTGDLRPSLAFSAVFNAKYVVPMNTGPAGDNSIVHSATVVTTNMKGELGRRFMAELNEHIGHAKTFCAYCLVKTGDREGLYAHLVSSAHLKQLAKGVNFNIGPICLDLYTVALNMHRKDLI